MRGSLQQSAGGNRAERVQVRAGQWKRKRSAEKSGSVLFKPRVDPISAHGLPRIICDVIAQILGEQWGNGCGVPAFCRFDAVVFDLGIPEFSGEPFIDMVDFQLIAVGQSVSAAHFGDQWKADEIFKLAESVGRDIHLDLFAHKTCTGLKTKDVFCAAAGHGFFADANGGTDIDISLSHTLLIQKRKIELCRRPGADHPFSFYFHHYLHVAALCAERKTSLQKVHFPVCLLTGSGVS